MKKLLLTLLVVSTTGTMFAGFSDDNLEAQESYRSTVANKGKMHSTEVQNNWESFKSRVQKKKPAQKVTAKNTAANKGYCLSGKKCKISFSP